MRITPEKLHAERLCRRLSCAAVGRAIGLTEALVFRMEKRQLDIVEHVAEQLATLFATTPPDPTYGVCVVCGRAYEPKRITSRHCGSKHCAYKAHLVVQNETASEVYHTCAVCGVKYTRAHGSGRRTCSRKCASAAMGKTRAMRPADLEPFEVDFYSMDTGCYEVRSWDCPEMDPFTVRIDHGGVWVRPPQQ